MDDPDVVTPNHMDHLMWPFTYMVQNPLYIHSFFFTYLTFVTTFMQ